MATTARVKVGDDPPSNLGVGTANGLATLDGTGHLTASQAPSVGGSDPTALHAANNLSDVASATTSRTNLGLGTAATHPAGDFAQTANNLSDLASASTARTNLGLGTAATAAKVAAGTAGVLDATDPTVNKVSSKAAAASVTNTVTLTTMATFTTIPAANITTNTAIRLDAHGTIDSGAGTGNFNMQIKVNGTLVATVTCAAAQTAGATGLTWNFNGQLYVDATGVSGSLMWLGTRMQRTAAGALNPTPDQGTATTVDISGGATVTLVASMGSANASNVFRLAHALAVQV